LLDATTWGGDACQGLSCLNPSLPNPPGEVGLGAKIGEEIKEADEGGI